MATTIQISDSVKVFLDKMRLLKRESYNDIIEFMIEDNMELNEKTRLEIEAARERVARGDVISHEDAMRQLGI